ncbi:hypothetical protein HPT25_06285 [Bacillus sp. BRMEA1]|uniref:hypothetical protein n=1 Tax=Neobacillus endophyticus TaxID=2738405 RepID=UPI001563D7E9|nr:hypothetical protein [Neobacillus endophyticus]NRD77103.1 hypothetical protein [Neobacillus endophyticus]
MIIYKVYDLQDYEDSWATINLETVRHFLLDLWVDLKDDDPYKKEIKAANVAQLLEMLEGCDYFLEVLPRGGG